MKNISSSLSSFWAKMAGTVLCLTVLYPVLLQAQSTFNSPENVLNHMVIEPINGDLYIGAVNKIYHLNSDLVLQSEAITGPKWDNPLCTDFDDTWRNCRSPENTVVSELDNYNKLLVIDKDDRKILTCGSVYQGTCELRNLTNVQDETKYHKLNLVSYALAPNSPEDQYTVVGMVSDGPTCDNSGQRKALYVGSSSTAGKEDLRSTIRLSIPTVSSHKLGQGQSLLQPTFFDALNQKLSGHILKDSFSEQESNLIQYKAGFVSGGFSYFLTIQPDDKAEISYVSKIIQICQSDCLFKSFVEIPITCTDQSGNLKYNLIQGAKLIKPGSNLAGDLQVNSTDEVLIATFSLSSSLQTHQPGTQSAVCIYTMKDIRAKFSENKQKCFTGQGSLITRYKGYNSNSQTCVSTGINATDNYCNTEDMNALISGSVSLSAIAGAHYADETITSIEFDVIDKYTVGFFGTGSGHLKRVLIKLRNYEQDYHTDVIEEGAPILQDMVLSQDRNFVFVMTSTVIKKLPVADCSSALKCGDCKELQNPYCGWCSLENKCSERRHCQNYEQDKRWLSLDAWCIKLTKHSPESVSVAKQISIVLEVNELPPVQPGKLYNCVFESPEVAIVTAGNVNKTHIKCLTPIPAIQVQQGKDNVKVNLFIESSETGVKFLQEEVDFYSCDVHQTCSQCSGSNWNCRWCLHDNQCIDSSSECITSSTLVTHSNECPQVFSINVDYKLIPVNFDKEIIVKGRNFPQPISGQGGYECLITINNEVHRIDATADSNTIECQRHSYSTGNLAEVNADIKVVWNTQFVIENNRSIEATVYDCNLLGQDCSSCVSLNATKSQYYCKFCDNKCRYSTNCPGDPVTTCPPPDIDNIFPLSGPIEGGTLLTIRGKNLGTNFEQVKNAVKIGEYNCVAIEEKYEVSKTIICETPRGSIMSVTVQVTLGKQNNDQQTVAYSLPFQYKDPHPQTLSPAFGPISGGTLVTITGTDLKTGAITEVQMGNNAVKCAVQQQATTDMNLICITDPSPNLQSIDITLVFDKAERSLPIKYEYRMDPEVTDVSPLKSYSAGGRNINVQGSNFNVVQQPLIFFENNFIRYPGNCTATSATNLMCNSPIINDSNTLRRKRQVTGTAYTVGFIMDGVSSVQNLTQNSNVSTTIEILPNPVYDKFKETQKYKGDSTLELTGSNLNLACSKEEVTVKIGSELNYEICIVNTLSNNRLYCKPPKVQPPGETGGALPKVTVEVGNLKYVLGEIEYTTTRSNEGWIIGVAIGGGVLLILIFIIVFVYHRKTNRAARQYKKLKMQLDTLESNVRNECKQAFAELQTEVSDFNSDISSIGIFVWDYKTYTFKVLFPSQQDHPVLHNGPEYMTNKFGGYDQGLHQFNQLLNSKHFMLIFIRTLEQQKNFGVRDKAVVASLLMIVLQDKMEYATEILKALLSELIDKSVEKKHPKLMLRRTESVVEKLLTNWLSICMYSYLKKHAGKELFMLYQAIKLQTEKGPVDALTSEARYSLSEDRLLRDKIEPKQLTIHLVTDGEREAVTCKVLDCDTITQAKQKALDAIYLNTPFSHRPSIYDTDLEWRSGKSGHLPLQDEDVTTEVIHGWKKVNTLLHYHVPDGAVMALVQKRYKTEGIRQVHGRIEITGSNGMAPIITMEEGQKVWHLLKHDDGLYQSRQQKVISEIFLTRLLATKGTLQQYIDELFLAILKVDHTIPPAIKWLFDFLDESARRHGIHDPDVVHTWKSNSLPLRFWVNIIKNPEFVFDIHKSNIVDSCLSVIAQTFMDSCSTMEHRLGKDSPSNKLLFAKDIPRYRKLVSNFYRGIQESQPVSDQAMNQLMTEMSLHYTAEFNVSIALKELFKYAHQYNFELLEALDEDPSTRRFHLDSKFEEVTANLEGSNY